MLFKDILTTQHSVRNGWQIPGMSKFIKAGGYFNRKSLDEFAKKNGNRPSPLVQINEFEDGVKALLDGHHRGIGILEGNRDFFNDDEIEVKHYTYKEFTDIVFLNPDSSWMGWVTPFDPRNSIRFAETKAFKDRVKDIYKTQSPQHAIHYILTNKDGYSYDREKLSYRLDTLFDMRDYWREEYKINDSNLAAALA